jgi:ribosomal protein S18 acetylase RimI-like enzyme
MIRLGQIEDGEAILQLAEVTFGFGPDELAVVRESLPGRGGPNDVHLVDVEGDAIVGMAYFAPERMTDGTWNLYMLGVLPSHRRGGRASRLIEAVEANLLARTDNRGRLLIVETIPEENETDFAAANALYKRHGFAEVARIPEFYAAGTDKLVYAKHLG